MKYDTASTYRIPLPLPVHAITLQHAIPKDALGGGGLELLKCRTDIQRVKQPEFRSRTVERADRKMNPK